MSEDKELERIKREMMRRLLQSTAKQSTLTQGHVVSLNESNFDRALNSTDGSVLVDFWAEWCGPCKMMGPIIDSLAEKYKGKMGFAKVNVDQNQGLARRYGVMSIPNFVVFKNGKPVERIIGAVGSQGIEKVIKKHLS